MDTTAKENSNYIFSRRFDILVHVTRVKENWYAHHAVKRAHVKRSFGRCDGCARGGWRRRRRWRMVQEAGECVVARRPDAACEHWRVRVQERVARPRRGPRRRGARPGHRVGEQAAAGALLLQEVPDDNRVVVRRRDDLKLVELKPEHAAGVLLYSQSTNIETRSSSSNGNRSACQQRVEAEGGGRLALIDGRLKVPDFDLAVVGARHDALAVETQTAHELLVTLEHPDAITSVDVPDATSERGIITCLSAIKLASI